MQRVLGVSSATALVIAAMVGAGIFTTTGLIAPELGSGRMLLLAWTISKRRRTYFASLAKGGCLSFSPNFVPEKRGRVKLKHSDRR